MEGDEDTDEGEVKFVAARSLSCSYMITENRALRFSRDHVLGVEDDSEDGTGEWPTQSAPGRIFDIDSAVSDLLENGRALDPTGRDTDVHQPTDADEWKHADRTLAEDQNSYGEGRQSLQFASNIVGFEPDAEESGGGFGGEESEPQENKTPTLDVESVGSAPTDEEKDKPEKWLGGGYGDDYSDNLDIDYFHDNGIRKMMINPIDPKQFNVCEWCDTSEYLIFLAIRQKVPSTFEDSVKRAELNVDADFNRDYLVPMGFRHIPMLVVNLTPEQVRGLNFSGELPMTTVCLEGDWAEQRGKPFECSVGIKRESQEELRRLLARVDGLPPMDEGDGDLMCDRIPLFCFQRGCRLKNRPERRTVGYDVRKEFRNLRMRSYNWWCVVGSSLRVKEVDAPFDNFRVLGDAVCSKWDAEADEDACRCGGLLSLDCDDDEEEESKPSRLKHLLE
mmetsp:Transcript_29580/g.70272  ORF Transcript_29580/g.70272 Transcript_29580/m.70272 type:complete len:448 (+) Transcript_29580:100-1443(+)